MELELEKKKFEFRKTFRNWFKDLSDEFPAYKSTIVQYYKANMNKSHDELLKEFYDQAAPYFVDLAKIDHAFFDSCVTFYPEMKYHEFVKGTSKAFRTGQMIYLNKLLNIAFSLLHNDVLPGAAAAAAAGAAAVGEMNDLIEQGLNPEFIKSLESNFVDSQKQNALLSNPLLSSLAEEISQEMTIPESFKNMENPQDVFKLMMNKDGKSFMEEMVKTVGNKIQNKIKNGELNEQDLFQQAQMMMGSVFNNNPMFGNLFAGGPASAAAAAAAPPPPEEDPAERKAELRKALREKLKNKRH